ncbi:MAG TPA: hypothetical protein VIV57_13155 [Anaeromyxobacter sp.]
MPLRPSPTTPALPLALDRRKTRIVWLAVALGLGGAFAAALVGAAAVPASPQPGLGSLLLLVAAPMTAIDLVLAYVLTGRMRRNPGAAVAPDASAATQTIVASASAMGAALMSCVFFFVTREPLLLLLPLPCAAVLLHWYPSEQRWSRLLPASAAPASRRMMRG